jgi:hypothetical protein
MKKTTIDKKWSHTENVHVKQALRYAVMPQVEDLVYALQEAGLTKTEACKTVRWAAHVIEGRHED